MLEVNEVRTKSKRTFSCHAIPVWRQMCRGGVVRVHAALIVEVVVVVDAAVVAGVEDGKVVAAVPLSGLHQ